ncbi:MAG: hypothetical protein ABSF61_09250 [Anaerolineales bacterium]|jgi:hypothetical protein
MLKIAQLYFATLLDNELGRLSPQGTDPASVKVHKDLNFCVASGSEELI